MRSVLQKKKSRTVLFGCAQLEKDIHARAWRDAPFFVSGRDVRIASPECSLLSS